MHNVVRSRDLVSLALLAATLGGCASMTRSQKAVAVGAGTGAVVGGVIGKNTGSTARGAIIGAAVGGTIGSIIGLQMDKQAREIEQAIPGAVVERVGEGIQVTFESGLLFDFDSDRIRQEARANLRNLAASLDKYPNTDLLIVGHTDAAGSDWYNLDLSERRASSAATYLATQGVDRSRLRTTGRGEREPVATNEWEAGRQQNRRVEIAIYASGAYREQLTSERAGR